MCEKKRCRWAAGSEEMIRYHDQEWGTPQHDDAKLFELFLLEGFQAGLSWAIVLKKREAFRRALDGFDAEKIAAYGEEKIQSLLQDESIIRSERKLRAAVTNAQTYLRIGRSSAHLANTSGGLSITSRCGGRASLLP